MDYNLSRRYHLQTFKRYMDILIRLLCTLLILSFLSMPAVSAEPSPAKVTKAKWYYVETDNFTIVTDVGKRTAAKVAQNLEKFRALVALINGGNFPVEARSVKVYVTDNNRNYRLLSSYNEHLKDTGGFFRNRLNGNYAVVRYWNSSSIATLFHEYTHYLTANMVNRNLPLWYSEGTADFLGEMEFRSDNVVLYGKANQHHLTRIASMRWMDVEELFRLRSFDRKNRKKTGLIYSMSWLVVHYFRSDPELYEQLRRYLQLTQDGMDETEALSESMNLTFKELNSNLRKYARKARFEFLKITLNDPLTNAQLKVSRLNRADAAYHIGEFFLQSGNDPERAERYFDESLEHKPEHASALAGKANVALFRCDQDDCKEAKTNIDKAKALDPDAPFVATISGHINAAMMKPQMTAKARRKMWNAAVKDYNKAINSGDTNLEAISAAASMYARENRWDKAYELYELVYFNAPSNHRARLYMIQAHLALGDDLAAELIADRVRNNNHFTEKSLSNFEEWYEKLKSTEFATEQ